MGNGVKAETEALAQAKAASNGYSLRLKPPRPSSTLPWDLFGGHGCRHEDRGFCGADLVQFPWLKPMG